tara:strand:+ start:730 stop:1062 length:333 start_codon:yes stop_codon:yes gene_type:complete
MHTNINIETINVTIQDGIFSKSASLFLINPNIEATLIGIDNLTLFSNICSNVNGNDIITNNIFRKLIGFINKKGTYTRILAFSNIPFKLFQSLNGAHIIGVVSGFVEGVR